MKKLILSAVLLTLALVGSASAAAQAKKIGMKRATQIASQNAPGAIEGKELEKEHGKWVYSFDIRNAKGTITEVQVDAYTGAVVSVEEEDAAAEAAEKKAEKKGRH